MMVLPEDEEKKLLDLIGDEELEFVNNPNRYPFLGRFITTLRDVARRNESKKVHLGEAIILVDALLTAELFYGDDIIEHNVSEILSVLKLEKDIDEVSNYLMGMLNRLGTAKEWRRDIATTLIIKFLREP